MRYLIKDYINSKALAWAPTTLKSEEARLNSLAEHMDKTCEEIWQQLCLTYSPYSRVTVWTRLTSFYSWLLDNKYKEGHNRFDLFRRTNARLFKNVYETKLPKVTFEEARTLLQKIKNPLDRQMAIQLLGSGERVSEGFQQRGQVIGKGNKPRITYRPDSTGEVGHRSYSAFSRSLKSVGLRAHDLRKLFATKLVDEGFKDADLLKVMGWSNMNTAKHYIQPKKDAEIEIAIKQIHKELYERL